MKRMQAVLALTGFAVMSGAAFGAEVTYSGSADSGDITLESNWNGGKLPEATDTAVFPKELLMPGAGLMLGKDFAIQNFKITKTDAPVVIDLNGKTIVMPETQYRGKTTASSTPAPEMYFDGSDGSHSPVIIQDGTITNLVHLNFKTHTDVTITNAHVYMQRPKATPGWYTHLTIAKGAVLEGMDAPYGDLSFPFPGGNGNAATPVKFTIDGGRVILRSDAPNWRRASICYGSANKVFEMTNGGRYDDYGTAANVYVGSPAPTLWTIHDGAVFTMTNGVVGNNSSSRGIHLANVGIVVAVSNATMRAARFNVCSRFDTNLFENAVADFSYYGPATTAANTNTCGYGFLSGATNSYARLGGAANDFQAAKIAFHDKSASNVFEMAEGKAKVDLLAFYNGSSGNVFRQTGGEFSAANVQMAGSGCNRLEVEGGTFTVGGKMYFDGATGGEMDFGAIDLTVAGNTEFWGQRNLIRYTGTRAKLGGVFFHDNGFNSMIQDGGAITSGVINLMTSGNTVTLTNRAYRYMQYRIDGLTFCNGKTNNVVVIDDSTIWQDGAFAGDYKSTGTVATDYGNTYTNCAGSAIVFRGKNPKLVFGNGKSSAGGGYWTTATLGSFGLGATLGTEPLKDPLEFRYVLPEDGYAEAPLQSMNPSADRPLVPAGNMRIVVDIGAFKPTVEKRSVPLVRDPSDFKCYSNSFIDIAALNRNNAANLPKNSRLKYVQEKNADGEVVAGRIDLVFRRGFAVIVR